MPIPAPSVSLKARSRISKTDWNAASQTKLSQPSVQDRTLGEDGKSTDLLGTRPSIGRPLSFHGDVEGTKRRSLLPQPGQTRYNTRSSLLPSITNQDLDSREAVEGPTMPTEPQIPASATEEIKSSGAIAPRLRPRSMYQTGTISPERVQNNEEAPTSQLMQAPAPINKSVDMQIPRLGRSQSLRKPGIAAQSTQPTTTAVHSRARSIHATASNQTTARPLAAPEKLKSLQVASSINARAHGGSTDMVSRGTRISARLLGASHPASAKAGPEVLNSNNSKSVLKEEQAVTRSRVTIQEESKKTARPTFSTLQQHFTPRKVGKAPTATFLHPPSVLGTSSLPPDLVNLQAELLQLHLLHDGSVQVSKDWEVSAKRSLQKKFEEVTSLHQVMVEDEQRGSEQKNLRSLLEWSTWKASIGLTEHIQILSEPLHELPVLLESGGRLHNLVADFDIWMSKTQAIRSARHDSNRGQDAIEAIESLEDSWQAENAALTRKLTAMARDLDKLDQPSAGSSIAHIVETCELLLGGILDELRTMQTIESIIVTKEKEWVEDRLQSIARDIGAHMVDSSRETVLWRS